MPPLLSLRRLLNHFAGIVGVTRFALKANCWQKLVYPAWLPL